RHAERSKVAFDLLAFPCARHVFSGHGIHDRRCATQRVVLGRHAPVWQSVPPGWITRLDIVTIVIVQREALMRGMSLLPRVAVLGIGLTVAGCGGAAPDPAASAPPAVTVIKVVAEDVSPSTSFTGRIEAKDKVELRARVEGFLEK